MKTVICFLVPCIMNSFSVNGQTYKVVKSEITVKGRSSDRDWKMTSQNSTCTAGFAFSGKKLTGIQYLNFSLSVKNLKGDNDVMNKRAYKALKAYPYSTISYTGKLFTVSYAGRNTYLVLTEGNLQIAGITHAVSVPVTVTVNENGTIGCTGSKGLKMSDYHVTLPEALRKTMNIRNSVLVSFSLILRNASELSNDPVPVQNKQKADEQ